MSREYVWRGSVKRLREIADAYGAQRILLVTGKRAFASSGAEDTIVPQLTGRTVHHFSDFRTDPRVEDVRRGIAIARELSADFIVAVGGGSALDMAKLINVLGAQPADCRDVIQGKAPISAHGIPLAAIPTTAGTGSEATHFAVVYIDGIKYSLAHPFLLPDHQIVDANLTLTLPPRLTAVTAFDALGQAVESYWAVGATTESQRYASEAIGLLLNSTLAAVHRPEPQVRERMALASHLAGKAINISKTTAAHAISYPLTMRFGIPHGHAVALTLGRFVVVNANLRNAKLNEPRGLAYVEKTMAQLCDLLGGGLPEACGERLYALMEEAGLETNLATLGVKQEADIDGIISEVNLERLSNNPVWINEPTLRDVLAGRWPRRID